MEKCVKVCVTGGAGYLASFLIKNLLERGYTVHATLRSLSDASKVGLLKSLENAETRLKLFEADIYKSEEFAAAIEGCQFVFHLATPCQHYEDNSQYKSISEATVAGVKNIAESCIKSNTVKKLIYTATVMAAAPLKDDGSGYKDFMDESCWTPLNLSYDMYPDYIHSKTLTEKQVLSYNGKGIQVVSLATGLVGGSTIQPFLSGSTSNLIAQALNDEFLYRSLKSLEELMSKVPIAHVQDVIEAHIFSMENSDITGRFLCVNAYLKTAEIASLIQIHHPDVTIPTEWIEDEDFEGGDYVITFLFRLCKIRWDDRLRRVSKIRRIEDTKRETKWGSRELEKLGFEYKFNADKIIDDSILCAKRLGSLH